MRPRMDVSSAAEGRACFARRHATLCIGSNTRASRQQGAVPRCRSAPETKHSARSARQHAGAEQPAWCRRRSDSDGGSGYRPERPVEGALCSSALGSSRRHSVHVMQAGQCCARPLGGAMLHLVCAMLCASLTTAAVTGTFTTRLYSDCGVCRDRWRQNTCIVSER